jgi:hypothetical protein
LSGATQAGGVNAVEEWQSMLDAVDRHDMWYSEVREFL